MAASTASSKSVTKDSLYLTPFLISLLSGAVAGVTVDTTLFPLDTIKTRLQSQHGFLTSGYFRGIYSGLGPVLLGSAPSAALFFVTYDTVKRLRQEYGGDGSSSTAGAGTHVVAASLGELAACSVRVPTEVLKQRTQARQHRNGLEAFREIWSLWSGPGSWRTVTLELYRGGAVTVLREIPFTMIQFPLWEWSKATYGRVKLQLKTAVTTDSPQAITPLESAICGSISGGTAALVTTPLDVLKTRMMLSRKHLDTAPSQGAPGSHHQPREAQMVRQILRELVAKEGYGALMKGWAPRMLWISIGGAVFLGAYDAMREVLESL